MNIGERLNFNTKIMEFCLSRIGWTHKGDQEEALNNFNGCVSSSIIAEQLFRAELNRVRPGVFKVPEEEDDE